MTEQNGKARNSRGMRGFRKMSTFRDVRRAGLAVANAIIDGKLKPAEANAITYVLSSVIQKSLADELLAARLDRIEAMAEETRPAPLRPKPTPLVAIEGGKDSCAKSTSG